MRWSRYQCHKLVLLSFQIMRKSIKHNDYLLFSGLLLLANSIVPLSKKCIFVLGKGLTRASAHFPQYWSCEGVGLHGRSRRKGCKYRSFTCTKKTIRCLSPFQAGIDWHVEFVLSEWLLDGLQWQDYDVYLIEEYSCFAHVWKHCKCWLISSNLSLIVELKPLMSFVDHPSQAQTFDGHATINLNECFHCFKPPEQFRPSLTATMILCNSAFFFPALLTSSMNISALSFLTKVKLTSVGDTVVGSYSLDKQSAIYT